MAKPLARAGCSLALGALIAGFALLPPAQGRQATTNRPDPGGGSTTKPWNGKLTEALVKDLRSKNLEVTLGYTHLYTQEDCDNYTYPILRNCFGNNPASPYLVSVVKRWADEYADPRTENALGKTPPGYTSTPRLDPREAIIVFGQMPPPARYLGEQSWVFTKMGGWRSQDYDEVADAQPDLAPYLFTTVPPSNRQTGRIVSFSGLNNNTNNVTIERQSGSVWNQVRYFVVTPDQKMDRAVRSSLQRLGVAGNDVFTDAIPPKDEKGSIGPIGLGRRANDFVTLIRYTMPEDKQAGDAWLQDPPLTILRVRERPSSQRAAQPYPQSVLDKRTAVPEQGLAASQQQLVKAICARAARGPWKLDLRNSGCDEAAPYPSSRMHDLLNELGQSGPECRSIGMDCLGDNQDASYFFAPARPLDGRQVYAVLGTLATATGNGTYVGLSVNDAARLKGVLNVPDTDADAPRTDLTGSADAYVKVKNRGKFFIHYFSRDCRGLRGLTGGACTTITEEMVARAGDDSAQGDPRLHGKVNFALRTYVKPGTERGPDPELQLKGRVLTFVRR